MTWKGFKQYIEYVFTIADVVLIQKNTRRWLAKRHVERLKIQRANEGLNVAATEIQRIWRGYQAQMNMLYTLVHIIIVQSVIRRKIALMKFKPMLMEHRAATTIQCAWRVKVAKQTTTELRSVVKIQAAARGWLTFSAYRAFRVARRIQSWYRCQATRRG